MRVYNVFLSVILTFILLLIISCGSSSEKVIKKEKSDEEKLQDISLPPDTQPLTAAILDFTNKTKKKEDEIFRTQIPDQMGVDISSWFSMMPNAYVRKKIKELSEKELTDINQKDLFDQNMAKEIGKKINVDVVIIGHFAVFGDSIQIIVYLLHVNNNNYQNFKINGKKNNILNVMNKISLKTMEKSKISFKPIKIKEKKLIKEATSDYIIEKITEASIKQTYKPDKSRSIKDDSILDENPKPAPKWIYKIPMDKDHIFYVGRAFEQKNYSEAFKKAIENAFEGISRIVGTSVDSQYMKIQKIITDGDNEKVRKIVKKNLVIKSLNNIRGAEIADQYFRKYKSKADKKTVMNDVAILYKISKKHIKESIKESIALEKLRAEERKLMAEKEKLMAEKKMLEAQSKLLEKMKKKEIDKVEQIKQNPFYSDKKGSKKSKTLKKTEKQKESIDKHPYRLYGYIAGGLGIVSLGYGVYQGINMNSLIGESNDLEDDYKTLTSSSDASQFSALRTKVNDKRDKARSAELQMYIFGGAGLALIGSGVFLYLYEDAEDSPVGFALTPEYSEVNFTIRF